MTSLPMPAGWSGEPLVLPSPGQLAENLGIAAAGEKRDGNEGDEQSLLHAFRAFVEVADSLEQSYARLRSEVERLGCELAASNSDLARSSAENRGMREYLDRILESLPTGVLVVDAEGRITRANPEALRLLGDVPCPTAFSLMDLPAAVCDLLDQARSSGTERETSLVPGAGPARWLAARHAALPAASGAASIFILRDVSERKRLEQAEARLRRDEALAEIAALLAHEIRNPLGSLELFAGLLAESPLAPEPRQWVEHVQAGLRTLSATVNNVLHFHSLPEPERAPLDLGQLLDWAHGFFAPLARQSRIALSLQNRVCGVTVLADRHRLEQVLLNLVLNGVRAMPGGGWIELGGRKLPGGHAVELTVADTGPGISPEDLPHIFDPGFSRHGGSPGLGLAVCRKIVQQHGGTIAAQSRPGAGAAFTVTLPLPACDRLLSAAAESAPGALVDGVSPGVNR